MGQKKRGQILFMSSEVFVNLYSQLIEFVHAMLRRERITLFLTAFENCEVSENKNES